MKLTAICDGCSRGEVLNIDMLIKRLGPEFRNIPQRLNPLMHCSRCGRKGATVHLAPPT